MIINSGATIALSNLGWVDRGSLFRYDARTGTADEVRLMGASHLDLRPGRSDTFSVLHHFGGSRLVLTAQTFDQPDRPLATIEVHDWAPQLTGDPRAWDDVSPVHVGYLNDDATGAAGYYLLRTNAGAASLDRLDWFGDDYDHGYQSVTAVSVVPESGDLLFGVQRSSELVLCDEQALQIRHKISLAGRYGNPQPHLPEHMREAWAIDYDTLVRLDRRTWARTGEIRLQREGARSLSLFVGRPHFTPDERIVLVPRPHSGDVVHVDTRSLEIRASSQTAGQPLAAALLASGEVIARDWKTGRLLRETENKQNHLDS